MRLDSTYQHLKRVRKEHESWVMLEKPWHEKDSLLGAADNEYTNRHGSMMGLCHRGIKGDVECVYIVLGIFAHHSVGHGHGGGIRAF
jgi:hypothetical protein